MELMSVVLARMVTKEWTCGACARIVNKGMGMVRVGGQCERLFDRPRGGVPPVACLQALQRYGDGPGRLLHMRAS